MLPTKPWRPEFGPLPAALAGRIPVEPAFSDRIRRAATRFYIDETAAIREEPDDDIARERQARLDETLNAAVEARRTGVLSPVAERLLEACDVLFSKGGDHEDLAASGLPLTTPVGTLLQLRPGQDVAVFDEGVTWDSRRRA